MKYGTVIHGGIELEKTKGSRKRLPLMPNPFPPDDIYSLVTIGVTMNGLALTVYKFIKLWIDDRKARKIKIRKGEMELEITGGMTDKQIQRAINNFRKVAKITGENKVKVTIPKGCDPSISLDLLDNKNRK